MGRLEGRTARNAEPVDPAIGTTHMCQCIVECGLLTGTRSAEGIMASGHADRINRPNTWLHRPTLRREVLTCQPGAVHTLHKADQDVAKTSAIAPNVDLSTRCPWSNRNGRQSQFSVVAGPGFGPIFGILVRSGIVF